MAYRLKNRWHDSGMNDLSAKTMDECAGALAYIVWRLAKENANNLYVEFYQFKSHGQLIVVICEYLAFEIQMADRVAYDLFDTDEERQEFIVALASSCAEHVQDNAQDFLGKGDYKTGFINTLNQRSNEYAEYKFTEDGPSYSFTRHLGAMIQKVMGDEEVNKWVINQVMEIDAPDIYKIIKKSMINLLDF